MKVAVKKNKKHLYKNPIKARKEENYVDCSSVECRYKLKNKESKEIWERSGKYLAKIERLANRAFYNVVRSMRKRNANHNIREIINDKNGSPLIESSKVTQIWKKYFNKLLN